VRGEGVTPTPFQKLALALDPPMFVVTTSDGRERSGCLIGFATQCSVDPPRFLACLSQKNRTWRVAQGAEVLVVHLVPSGAKDLAELFGEETGDEVDKFARVDWHEGPGGAPVLDRCDNWFAGRILERHDVGDHTAHLLEPFEAETDGGERGLTFRTVRDLEPGHGT
jgi:flavin reductase (DIM6/NTAB) family NADH-FMN oxidoreductase RutF